MFHVEGLYVHYFYSIAAIPTVTFAAANPLSGITTPPALAYRLGSGIRLINRTNGINAAEIPRSHLIVLNGSTNNRLL